mmetsp:Transcript_7721/g.16654  ORF Transcript_7721/g.16654 Transcript_7721/m.16654 type:complete len:257 (-) Transcript_7721:416-1186(-)|eukprot:CAMPEP_0202893420 /NCGR_PEP_ID=MMETSP1392-20130828/3005_1 /ASSEMBLY_ACC=CAM_ASM_000868 /TAXON_ID=225041 /ORGANISM="Chlamydomonas chlamydogama, Strain SAG 11-48b" /LENGTH=256 /DNA_ID=CAMNT_0049577745 /DNA_START=97 /DNA_END=867 /DNA_ORIENTATION=-
MHKGTDHDGRNFESPNELWQQEQDHDGTHKTWYQKAVNYWDQQEASYNGVLGGYGYVSDIDVKGSKQLIEKILRTQLDQAAQGQRTLVALDCGAGVGRVSQELLLHYFQEVDLLEPSSHLLNMAKQTLTGRRLVGVPPGHNAVNFYLQGLQEHVFEPQRYDCVWIQWCMLYLTDDDVVQFFSRARTGLKSDGLVVVKENICKEGFVVDKDDSSLTRSNTYMLELFGKSNMEVLYNVKQKNFPKELFEVRMYVLRPR